jgi:probable HAF family extracellular repeat protein
MIGESGSFDAPRGFSWKNGKLTDLGSLHSWRGGSPDAPTCNIDENFPGKIAINESGQVVGERAPHRAFPWANGRMTDLALPRGSTASGATAISNRGQIVGWCKFGGGNRPCLWANGKVTNLGILERPGRETDASACAITPRGDIGGDISYLMDFGQAVRWTLKTGG